MERLKIVGRWLWAMLWPFLALVTGFLATLETIALLYYPNPSIFWQRQIFWSGTWIAFVLSAFWAWIKQYRTNEALKSTIRQQDISLAQATERETFLTVANAELTATTEALQGEIEVLNDQLTPTLTLSAPFVELSRYRDESVRNGSKYFHIVRVSVHNPGSVGISRIRVIAKDFIWHYEDYSGKAFYPKDDFNTHSDGSFYLDAGGTRHVDIALREPSPAVGQGSPMTHFRLALPPYMSNVIGDNEILGLTVQVVAPGYPQTPEQRLDLYLEKQQVTKSTGEVSYQKSYAYALLSYPHPGRPRFECGKNQWLRSLKRPLPLLEQIVILSERPSTPPNPSPTKTWQVYHRADCLLRLPQF